MLALDIETLGLLHEKPLPSITCVCLYGHEVRYKLLFYKVSEHEFEENRRQLMQALDEAPHLAGFNAVYFDLEYIRLFFGVPDAQAHAWRLKCIDPFMVARNILKLPCSLNHLLALNALHAKTGCGENAIQLAREEKWEELLAYCMMDAQLTYALCTLPSIRFSKLMRGKYVQNDRWHFMFVSSYDDATHNANNNKMQLPTILYHEEAEAAGIVYEEDKK